MPYDIEYFEEKTALLVELTVCYCELAGNKMHFEFFLGACVSVQISLWSHTNHIQHTNVFVGQYSFSWLMYSNWIEGAQHFY